MNKSSPSSLEAACGLDHPAPSPPRTQRGRQAAHRGLQRGITLVEVLTVMCIIAVMSTAAIPAWERLLERLRVAGESSELVADLLYMRSHAILRNADVGMTLFNSPGGSCYVVHTGPASACECNGSEQASCDVTQDAHLLKSKYWLAESGRRLESNASTIRFDPRTGLAAPGGTVRLVDGAGLDLRHVVSLRGRVRTCWAGNPVAGHPRC